MLSSAGGGTISSSNNTSAPQVLLPLFIDRCLRYTRGVPRSAVSCGIRVTWTWGKLPMPPSGTASPDSGVIIIQRSFNRSLR
ncbi:hypothetical protein WJX73_009796 [Symbiochloris irregularis]|uniref:Uncharacterized protein n=1 Tax=Symbiochloris irregularis TaxID=706552 RepID=A0AAW1PLF4_9CHLO